MVMQRLRREDSDREVDIIREALRGALTQSLPHGCLRMSQTNKGKSKNGEPTENAKPYGI